MHIMGQHGGATAGVALVHSGAQLLRSNQPIIFIASQSAPPAATVFHNYHSALPTASLAPPPHAAAAVSIGRQKLGSSGHSSGRRVATLSSCLHGSDSLLSLQTTIRSCSPRPFDSAYTCSTSNSGLLTLWIPGSTRKMSQDRLHLRRAAADEDINEKPMGKRKVVEHVVLFKMKDSLTEEQEKEMLDNLWSLQYQVKNVLCTTVGRLVQKTPDGYTHALFSRFPNKQALDYYLESPACWRVAQDLVIPYYDGKLVLDFEGEVEDDIETIFRRGDDFQEGVEHFLFFKFKDNISSNVVDKFLNTANSMPEKFGAVVQLTVGCNLHSHSQGIYSHGLVARLPSEEAHAQYEQFLQSDSSWVELTEVFEISQTLQASFVVTPVGKAVM